MKLISRIFYKIFKISVPFIKTPLLTVDGIVEVYDEEGQFKGIVLIERKNPPFGFALPGGFVEYGESPERAVLREVKEETGVNAQIKDFLGVYGEPGRDPRFHTVTCVYILRTEEEPKASSDAKRVYIFDLNNIPFEKIVFDHPKIIRDYLKFKGIYMDENTL